MSMSADQRSQEQLRGRLRGRKLEITKPQGRSISLECPSSTQESPGGLVPDGISSTDVFIISRLGDTTSYFFSWFCKKYRIRIGARDLGAKEETQSRCPICLDAFTKSTIELRCGHSFCRSCLTRSAANNMTSCALCRKEQEINPELLRARFDEQRMLNLAQRLAIPPPLRSRPSPPAASLTAAEGQREGKGGPRSRGTATLPREMLFGPWGDVGAMSADHLRRRWKFSSAQTSTVGAASASELRSSWHELKLSMHMQGDSEHSRMDSVSCSGDTDVVVHEVGDSIRHSPTACPGSASPLAGGTLSDDLSIRWRSLTKMPPRIRTTAEGTATDEFWGDTGGLDGACLRKRWLEADGLDSGVGSLEVGELSERLTEAFGSQDIGSLSSASLRKRWLEADGLDSGIGHLALAELSGRLNQAIGSQDIGSLSPSSLRKRWLEAGGLDSGVGQLELGELSDRLNQAVGSQGIGSLSSASLRKRWLEANGLDSGVGQLELGELSERLNQAVGSQGIGSLSSASLRKRWLEANGLDSSVGHLEPGELSEKQHRAMGSQGVGAITGAKLEKRWNADVRHEFVDNGNSVLKQAAGVVSTTAVGDSWHAADGSAPVG